MTDVPSEELKEALGLWVDIQIADPEGIARYLQSHDNPFIPLPPDKEKIDAFILLARSILPEGAQKLPMRPFDAYMREEFVKEYVSGAKMAKMARSEVEQRTKKFLEENFRIAFTPNAPELKEKVAPDQRSLLFVKLNTQDQDIPPSARVEKAVTSGKIDQAFRDNSLISGQIPSLLKLPGLTPAEQAVAKTLDATLSPAVRLEILPKAQATAAAEYLGSLVGTAGEAVVQEQWYQDLLLNAQRIAAPGTHVAGVPDVVGDVATSLFRSSFIHSVASYAPVVEPTFPSVPVLGVAPAGTKTVPSIVTHRPVSTAFVAGTTKPGVSATTAIPPSGGKEPAKGAAAVIAAIASAVNRTNAAKQVGAIKPAGAKSIPAVTGKPILISSVVVAYIEWYRISVSQGLPPPTFAQFQAAHLSMGSQAFHIGADLLKNYAMQEVKTGARATLTKGLVAIGGDAVAGLLGPMGWAAAIFSFGGSLIGKAARGLQALVGLKTPNDKETNLLIWGIVAIVALTPMTLALLQLDVPNSSLATRLPRGGASSSNGTFPGSPGSGGVPLPTYTPDPKTPLVPSQVTDCPTKNVFQLTQCPDGKYSHKNIMCAYDIGMADGTPIYATHNGIVSLYLPQGSSSGYGNMVEIMGKTPSGQTYYTLYGHLRTAALPVGSQVIAGQTIIGYSDNTGNSSGSHLHYELRSSTNAVLPDCGIHFLPAYCVSNPGYCNL